MNTDSSSNATSFENVQELLKGVAENEQLRHYEIQICEGNTKGNGYLGIITIIKILGKDKQDKEKILNVIIKSASKNDALRSQIPTNSVFERENYAYAKVFPELRNFEIEKGLLPSVFSAKFYKGIVENKSEALVLENLITSGFRLHDPKTLMNDEHVSLVVEQYGKFHALSLAIHQQKPERFKEVIASMDDLYSKCMIESGFVKVFKQQCIKAKGALNPQTHKNELEIYEKFIDETEQFFNDLRDYVDEYSVALHGDCWMNNMMFKYRDKNHPQKPTEVCFLDFQLMRIGSPLLDFVCFIYTSGSNEIVKRDRHYLNLYYESLSTHLRKLGGDPDKLFPVSVMEKQFKRLAKLGLILSFTSIYVILTEKDQRKDLNDIVEAGQSVTSMFDYDLDNMDGYYDRVKHIILHFINSDLL